MAKIKFVLNQPRNPKNIGAAARGMANYGFRDLAVVKPYAPIWRETRSAVNAHEVVRKAKKFGSLIEAIKSSRLVIGTSAGSRRGSGGRWIGPDELQSLVHAARNKKKSVAILFGSEKSGLSNEDLDHCHFILKLPTAPECPSMNLAQAVAVVAYIIRDGRTTPPPGPEFIGAVSANDVDRLVSQASLAFTKAGLLKGWNEKDSAGRMRRSFLAWDLNRVDIAMLHSLFRWVIKKSAQT